MDHDAAAENRGRGANRYCQCPAARYLPWQPKPTAPECTEHNQGPTEGLFS